MAGGISAAQERLFATYERTYGRAPGLAARRLQEAHKALQRALDAGDVERAQACTDQVDALTHVLTKADRCQRCGRALRHPDSVAAGIGPECAGKEA